MLTQSCAVYDTSSVTLSQALYQGKVKLIYKNGQEYKFDNIVIIDSVYHGMGIEYLSEKQYVKHEKAKMPIDSASVSSIYIKDIRKSSNRTVLFVLAGIPITYMVLGIAVVLIFVII